LAVRGTSDPIDLAADGRPILWRPRLLNIVWSRGAATKQFPTATKPFYSLDAKLLKSLSPTDDSNDALNGRGNDQTGGRPMFNLDAFTRHCRRAAAFGALAVGAIAFTSAAVASPLPLFPFILMPPIQAAPPPAQAAPSDDDGTVVEMPARLKRQIVSYATREAPGTI